MGGGLRTRAAAAAVGVGVRPLRAPCKRAMRYYIVSKLVNGIIIIEARSTYSVRA